MEALVETSMSALQTYMDCPRKYMYGDVRGWLPRTASRAMLLGTLYHVGLQMGYEAVREFDSRPHRSDRLTVLANRRRLFRERAIGAVYATETDRDGKALGLTQKDRNLVEDMILYACDQYLMDDLDRIEEIIAVEEPLYVNIGRFSIRCTLDVVARYVGNTEPTLKDHKTGDPTESKAYLAIDWQTRMYYIAARGKWSKAMQFEHRWQGRDVPPGFGHRSLVTETGKTRSAETLQRMQDPTRYVGEAIPTLLTDSQIDAATREVVDVILELEHSYETDRWLRRRVKTGPMACGGCPYFGPCTAELNGENYFPGVGEYIIRGSDEWEALRAGKLALEAK
jgi:hypothetical protein